MLRLVRENSSLGANCRARYLPGLPVFAVLAGGAQRVLLMIAQDAIRRTSLHRRLHPRQHPGAFRAAAGHIADEHQPTALRIVAAADLAHYKEQRVQDAEFAARAPMLSPLPPPAARQCRWFSSWLRRVTAAITGRSTARQRGETSSVQGGQH